MTEIFSVTVIEGKTNLIYHFFDIQSAKDFFTNALNDFLITNYSHSNDINLIIDDALNAGKYININSDFIITINYGVLM